MLLFSLQARWGAYRFDSKGTQEEEVQGLEMGTKVSSSDSLPAIAKGAPVSTSEPNIYATAGKV